MDGDLPMRDRVDEEKAHSVAPLRSHRLHLQSVGVPRGSGETHGSSRDAIARTLFRAIPRRVARPGRDDNQRERRRTPQCRRLQGRRDEPKRQDSSDNELPPRPVRIAVPLWAVPGHE